MIGLCDAHDFKDLAIPRDAKRFSVRREMRVPNVEITPQRCGDAELMPKVKDLVNRKERYYQPPMKISETVLHHILHPDDDEEEVDEEHKHIPLDLGTQTLQRIIDQMKTIMTIPHSEPTLQDAYNSGMPRYCEYLRGEGCHEPTVRTLEQILQG